jgi:hypothetical protein
MPVSLGLRAVETAQSTATRMRAGSITINTSPITRAYASSLLSTAYSERRIQSDAVDSQFTAFGVG